MRVRTRLFTAAVVGGALVAPLVPLGSTPAGAVSTPEIDLAVDWLVDQQQPDGGFETAGFPGFETSDAIFALAAAGQADSTWSTDDALAAVQAVETAGGLDPLDSIDDWVDSVQGDPGASAVARASQAAKVVVLVAAPLGFDADAGLAVTDFDPSGDTDTAVDLRAAIESAAGSGDYAGIPFAQKVYVAWALDALGEAVPAPLRAAIVAAQQEATGGFDFTGDPAGTELDPDITASVLIALRDAAPVDDDDTFLPSLIQGLGDAQLWTGEWAGTFDDGNANSTAMVMLAAAARGSDADGACWKVEYEPGRAGVPYPSPAEAIIRRQAEDGHVTGPFDGDTPTTFATSQAIQALAAAEGAAFYQREAACEETADPALRLVNALYVDLLDREPEAGGREYWVGQIEGGMSPALLAKRFVGTQEYGRQVVDRLYLTHLGRPATAGEMAWSAPSIVRGLRVNVAAALLGGDEYLDLVGGTPEDWAAAAYEDALGRPATAGEITYVTERLETRTRSRVARDLFGSVEGRRHLVREIYRDLLRRDPEPGGLTYWAGELARGVSPERLVTLIIGSAEYRGLTAPPA